MKTRFISNFTRKETEKFLNSENCVSLVRLNNYKNLINLDAISKLKSKK